MDGNEATCLESWRRTWRVIQSLLSTEGLVVLRRALAIDSPKLISGGTTTPPPLGVTASWPVEAADPVAYVLWRAEGLSTVEDVEEGWKKIMALAGEKMGEPDGARWWINWMDDSPRHVWIAEMLREVERGLAERGVTMDTPAAAAV